MARIIALLGATGSGKSDIAIRLAQKLNCQIINFDIYQMYQDFNIGTGKYTKEEMKGIPHLFIDFVNPQEVYTIYDYQKEVRKILNNEENSIFIMTGGSNLYLSSVIYDYQFSEDKNQVEYDFSTFSNEELASKLKELDFDSFQRIHVNNRQRLERALSAIYLSGNKKNNTSVDKSKPLYPVEFIQLKVDRKILYERAEKRFDQMLKNGLVAEVKNLMIKYSLDLPAFKAIGYPEIAKYLNGELTLEEATELAKKKTRNYIKRQETWLNNQYIVDAVDVDFIEPNNTINEILKILENKGII